MKPLDEPTPGAAPTGPYETRPLGQALDFLRVLWAINHGLATTSRYMKSKYGVTGRQRLIIQVVNEFPGISAGDLAKVLHLDPSTLTGVLQQMSQRSLLQLQPDMRDRRRLRIQLTTKGRRLSHMADNIVFLELRASGGIIGRTLRIAKARGMRAAHVWERCGSGAAPWGVGVAGAARGTVSTGTPAPPEGDLAQASRSKAGCWM